MVQMIKLMSAILVLVGLGSCGWRGQLGQMGRRAEEAGGLRRRGGLAQQSSLQQPQFNLQSGSWGHSQKTDQRLSGQVVAVPTGDAIVVRVDQQQRRLRLCGIDAPELTQLMGKSAQGALQKLVKGQQVEFDLVRRQSQQWVAEVFVPQAEARKTVNQAGDSTGQLVNQELVEAGVAGVYPGYVEECPHRTAMIDAETMARQQRRGMWAKAALLPWEYRRQTILRQLAHPVEAAKVLARFSSDYLRDGMQQTILGMASWYGPALHGQLTASGERFNENALTAAHPSLPFNTRLQVTNLQNNKTVIVRINDYHPAQHGSVLDLSKAAAEQLDAIQAGIVPVAMEVLNGR